MISSILKYGFAIGALTALGFGVLRLIQDGPGGELISAITFNTGILALGIASILQAIQDKK